MNHIKPVYLSKCYISVYIKTKPLPWRHCWTPRVCPRPSRSDQRCAGHSHSPGSSGSWPYPPPPQTVSISRLVTRTQSTASPRQTGSFWLQWLPDYRPHRTPGTWEQDQDRIKACSITLTLVHFKTKNLISQFEVCYPLWNWDVIFQMIKMINRIEIFQIGNKRKGQ